MTEALRRIESGDLFTEDFTIACHYPRSMLGGEPCTSHAAYWVERHAVNCCRHPSLDNGCASSFVCADHLKALEVEADRIVRRTNPKWWMFWRPERGWCRSCGRQRIQVRSDVLQYAKEL